MADGFIVRRGGKAEEVLRTAVPSINPVESTDNFVFTFTNNDAVEADIYFGVTSPPTNKITVAGNTTSPETTVPGLIEETEQTIFAYAIATDPSLKKIKSEIVSTTLTQGAAVYTAATGGTTNDYDSGGKRFRSHTFTSNGTFEVTTAGNGDRNKVDYLIIAGGASGGRQRGGGGGAGGYRTTNGTSGGNSSAESKVTVTATTYNVVIGGGGTPITSILSQGNNGSNSSAFSIVSTGGGGGGAGELVGVNGGSGGGGGWVETGGGLAGGTGVSSQGFNGGNGDHVPGQFIASGGGGGAGEAGGVYDAPLTGKGGDGLANLLRTGSNETRAGGGSGGGTAGQTTGNVGGAGGGGVGTANAAQAATPGEANTGSGGGGARSEDSGAGGSGIVIIRYEIAPTT
jgi:hypothetical protein